jgi:glycosyltransferase involved in cell wall biosynthesis
MNLQTRPKRLVIIDPGLKDFAGHYYETDMAIVKAACAEGFQCVILAHQGLAVSAIPEAEIEPIYSVGIWTLLSGPFHQWPSNLKVVSQRLFEETIAYFERHPPQANDIIYIPNIVQGQLLAVAMFAEFLLATGARLVLMFRYSSNHVVSTVTKQVFRRLESVADHSNISLVTDSQKLADELSRFTSLPFQVLPVVLNAHEFSNGVGSKTNAPKSFHILSLGNPRAEKGFCELLDAIEILETHPTAQRINFTIQAHEASAGAGRCLRRFRRDAHPGVSFVDKPLGSSEYHALIATSNLIVLPYHRREYCARTSGIFLEAVLSGKPVLVTRGTWMQDLLQEYGNGLVIDDHDAMAIATGILAMTQYRELFESRAHKAQHYWRHIHNPSEFIRMLADPTATMASNSRKRALLIASDEKALESPATNIDPRDLVLELEKQGYAVHCITLERESQLHPIGERSTIEGLNVSSWSPNLFISLVFWTRRHMRKWISGVPMTSYERFLTMVESDDHVVVHDSAKAKLGTLTNKLRYSHEI